MNRPVEDAFCRGEQGAQWRSGGSILAVNSAPERGFAKQSLVHWMGQSWQAEACKREFAAVLVASSPVVVGADVVK
jgi:hypothetical protein